MDLSRRRALQLGALSAVGLPLVLAGGSRAASTDTLPAGASLVAGQTLVSAGGRFRLAMQGDGNAVVYDGGRAIWASGTAGSGATRLSMNGDGNVVLYSPTHAVWDTGTTRAPGSRLVLQPDGNLVVRSGALAVWASRGGRISYPAYHPLSLLHAGASRQLLVVSGASPTSTYATAYSWARDSAGTWSQPFSPVAARSGYGGWLWPASRRVGDGASPVGSFGLYEAYGLAADPGSKLPYTHVGPGAYRAGDPADPRTYNVHQPVASAARTWRVGPATSERYADFPTQYQHLVNIEAFSPAPSTISHDTAHDEYVTSAPTSVGHCFAIYLHINGAGSTAGCISLPAAQLTEVVRWLDPTAAPKIVMAPTGWLTSA